mmetsp:Transcript_11409/g.28089  ORF Transcript_11409/g.28089 Transcript_11409/m.28089 type:complete len:216 (+) Transcript_11409:860-1507(+)
MCFLNFVIKASMRSSRRIMDEKDTSMSSSEPNDSLKRFGSHVLFREFLYKYARRAASSTTLPSRSIMSNSTAVRSTSVRYGYLRETAGCGRFRSPRIRLGSLVAARGTRLDWTGELLSEPPSKSSPNGISEPLHDSGCFSSTSGLETSGAASRCFSCCIRNSSCTYSWTLCSPYVLFERRPTDFFSRLKSPNPDSSLWERGEDVPKRPSLGTAGP